MSGKRATRPRWQRWLRTAVIVLVSAELVYLVAANVILNSGLIPHIVQSATPMVKLNWDHAFTILPGHSSVTGFSMQIEDEGEIQMDLRVEHATTTIQALPLFHRMISLDGTRAHGVTFRMLTKVDAADLEGMAKRLSGFPKIPGLTDPPVKPKQRSKPPTDDEIDQLFGIEMTDVMADMKELWFDEYRYIGPSHVKGGFALVPLKELWVGPALMTFDGGKLSAGPHTLLPRFTAGVEFEIARVSLLHEEASVVASTMNARVRSVTEIEGLDLIELYVDGVEIKGGGLLTLDVGTKNGKVTPDSTVQVSLPHLAGGSNGFSFAGATVVDGSVTDALELKVAVDVKGKLTTPVLDKRPLVVDILSAGGEVLTKNNDLRAGLGGLNRATGRVNEARADDAGPVTEAAGTYVPIVGPAVLGNGPLTGELTATYTSQYALLRLKHAKLGSASVVGAMVHNEKGWNGAAAGVFGMLPIGLLVEKGKLGYRPSANGDWLAKELDRCGISPEATPAAN